MSFQVLAVRSGDDPTDPLYPTPERVPDAVKSEPEDGERVASFVTDAFSVWEASRQSSPRRLIRVFKVEALVQVMGSRLTVACSKYEQGGGWRAWSFGALPVALIANTVSKARATRRRRGKMLVGHIRYEWVLSVGMRAGKGRRGRDTLRIGLHDPHDLERGLILSIGLARGQSGAALARQVAAAIARYRLDCEPNLDEPTANGLRKLLEPKLLMPLDGQIQSYALADGKQSRAAAAIQAHGG